jgi:DNA glycosylase AlkZ-like
LLAVQGQDPRGARLAIRARSHGLTAAAVDTSLTMDRSLVITWLNRGTLHLARSEDYWLLQQVVVRPQYELACLGRAAAAGVPATIAERAVTVIADSLAAEGPLTRAQLGERLAAAGIRGTNTAPLQLIMLTCVRGMAVRGPMIGRQHAYVLTKDWLGEAPPRQDRDIALAELARRYLTGHGPASDADLAAWAGLPVGEARRGLSGIAGQLRDRADGLAELAGAPQAAAGLPAPRLLGAYDPVLLGWASRAPIVGPHRRRITSNGLFRPFALVDGEAAAIWSWSAGQVQLEPLGELTSDAEAALAAEARDVRRFLGAESRADPS